MEKPFNTEASSSQKPGHHTKVKRPRHEAQDTPSTAKTPPRSSSPDQLNLVPHIMAKPFKAKVPPPIQATVSKYARKTPSKPEASSSPNSGTSPHSTSSEMYLGRRFGVNLLTKPFKTNVHPFKMSHHASEPQASTSQIGHNVTAKRPRHEDRFGAAETPSHHSSSELDPELYRRPPRQTPWAEMIHHASEPQGATWPWAVWPSYRVSFAKLKPEVQMGATWPWAVWPSYRVPFAKLDQRLQLCKWDTI
jgi:hypothetical protein